jgi:omega-6 fatty acid desaturase (delta-12 desaturase)
MVTTRRQSARPQAPAAALERQPTAVPPFTIGALRKAIPAHCFKRSLLKSSAYLAVDLLMAALLYLASTRIDGAPVPTWCKFGILWPLYWFFQGAVCTGLWVIAHECGHQVSASLFCRLARVPSRHGCQNAHSLSLLQAFSESQAVNDGVGLVVHSCLLVPYYSWKHSHRRHHSSTGNLAKDEVRLFWGLLCRRLRAAPATSAGRRQAERPSAAAGCRAPAELPAQVFVPEARSEVTEAFEWEQLGLVRMIKLVITMTLGWPMYLAFNSSSHHYERFANHFDPWSPIFRCAPRQAAFQPVLVFHRAGAAASRGGRCLARAASRRANAPHPTPHTPRSAASASAWRWQSAMLRWWWCCTG